MFLFLLYTSLNKNMIQNSNVNIFMKRRIGRFGEIYRYKLQYNIALVIDIFDIDHNFSIA